MAKDFAWDGIATADPRKVVIVTSTRRQCAKCKAEILLSEEEAAKDPLVRTIYYCSTDCSLD